MNAPRKQGSFYYRDLLGAQARAFYDSMLARFLRKDYSGVIPLPVTDPQNVGDDCNAAFLAIRDDHPELFYLGTRYELVRSGTQATMKWDILYSQEDIPRIQHQLSKRICKIVHGTADLSLVEREQLVYERIAKQLTYVNNHDYRDHNIVGPVLMSAAVCEGYNAMLMLCLRRVGIPCIKVYGKSRKDGLHCWSIVWIQGEPVHCDVTWDTPHEGTVFFDYFNLSDRQIGRDHFDFQGDNIPVCTAEHLNYYRLHRCSFPTQIAYAGYVCSVIQKLHHAPVFAQLCFADTEETIRSAVNNALNSCTGWPPCSIRMNPAIQTAVLLPSRKTGY